MKADDINFLPESYRQAGDRRRLRLRVLGVAVLVAAGLLAAGLPQRGSIREARQQAERYEAEAQLAESQRAERRELLAEIQTLREQRGVQAELLQPVGYSQALSVLAELLPTSVGVMELSIEAQRNEPEKPVDPKRPARPQPKAGQAAPREYLALEIEAIAPADDAVNDTVARMTEHALFENVALKFSRESTQGHLRCRRFVVTAEIDLGKTYLDQTPKEVADAG